MTQRQPGTKYSLWLMPTGDVCEHLTRTLQQLSAKHHAPEFSPHVTLLGGIVGPRREVIRKTTRLAGLLHPFTVRLGKIDYLDEYFRCLFVRVTAANTLRVAHKVACEVFSRHYEPPFMPHLSLLYGNFSQSLKEAIVAELGMRIDLHFRVHSVHLCLTEGEPHHWRREARFRLGQSAWKE